MRIKILLIAALGLLASACAAPTHMRSDYGYNNYVNTRVQYQDPTAEGREHPQLLGDGQKTEQALERFRKEKPETVRERVVTGLGGSGSSSGN